MEADGDCRAAGPAAGKEVGAAVAKDVGDALQHVLSRRSAARAQRSPGSAGAWSAAAGATALVPNCAVGRLAVGFALLGPRHALPADSPATIFYPKRGAGRPGAASAGGPPVHPKVALRCELAEEPSGPGRARAGATP